MANSYGSSEYVESAVKHLLDGACRLSNPNLIQAQPRVRKSGFGRTAPMSKRDYKRLV